MITDQLSGARDCYYDDDVDDEVTKTMTIFDGRDDNDDDSEVGV